MRVNIGDTYVCSSCGKTKKANRVVEDYEDWLSCGECVGRSVQRAAREFGVHVVVDVEDETPLQ